MLHSFVPQPGDCVFLEAGTVHAIGANVLLFEVQQTSDITYRLYDWDRMDAKTGQPRQLHVEEGLACTDFTRGPCPPVQPKVTTNAGVRPRNCLWIAATSRSTATPDGCRSRSEQRGIAGWWLGLSGSGTLEWRDETFTISRGDAFLLPAKVGKCTCRPEGEMVVLECGLPG